MRRDKEFLEMISSVLYEAEDIDLLLQRIGTLASDLVSAEGSSILIFSDDRSHLYFKHSRGKTAPILRRIKVSSGIAWWVAQTGESAIVNDVESDSRFTGEVDRITGLRTRNLICVPLKEGDKVIGVIEVINKVGDGGFIREDLELLEMLARQVAVAITFAERLERYRNFFSNSIEIFVKAIETIGVRRGIMFPGHCWRIAEASTFMGQLLGVNGKELDRLYYGAALHDIGILECRDEVWEPVLEEPWQSLKNHPVAGANMIREIKLLADSSPIIRHHHENFDGTGYPDGLEGEKIPIGARIVSVAERYEELLLNSSQTNGSRRTIVDKMEEMAGKELDPGIVGIFLSEILRVRGD
ncbi:GAF domain-containing protein [Candidatus Poribacteria bacterium]|nr:GAF domain-containing protein [Candidatus Poribacteria bacterium]